MTAALVEGEPLGRDMRGCAEGGVGIAEILHETGDDIVGAFGSCGRRSVSERGRQVDHRGQRLVIDDHPFGGIFRKGAAVRDDHRDRFAHMAYLVSRQYGLFNGLANRCIRHLAGYMVRREMRREIVIGIDRVHARCLPRGHHVNRRDAGMRICTADEVGVHHVGIVDVVGETRSTLQQGRVFHAFDALSEHAGNGTARQRSCHLAVALAAAFAETRIKRDHITAVQPRCGLNSQTIPKLPGLPTCNVRSVSL
jgi:hypothetical protein